MSSTTYSHFPDLQAARRRARDAELKAFKAFQATEETRITAVKAAEVIYRAAIAAADAAAKETRTTYETAAAIARSAERTLDRARIEAGGRRPVRYQVSDDVGEQTLRRMIESRSYSTVLPADTSYNPHPSTDFLARMHAEGVDLDSHTNVCDMGAWRNLKEIKMGDILYLVTSSNSRTWVPSKIYKGAVRSGPVHTLVKTYGSMYHRGPMTSLEMTWEVSWRLLGEYDESYKDCFVDLTNGSAAVKIKKPLPLPTASGALPPTAEA